MEIYIVAVVLAIVIAVSVYELVTGSAGYRIWFSYRRVTREDQPLAYWALIGLKLLVVAVIAWRTWGGA